MGFFRKNTEQKIDLSAEEKKPEEKKIKKANRKRSVAMTIRMTPEEAEWINEKIRTSGMNKTDFIISAINEVPLIVIEDAPAILKELRKQGANLNQAVRLAHQNKTTNIPEIEAALKECHETQDTFINFIATWDMKIFRDLSEGD